MGLRHRKATEQFNEYMELAAKHHAACRHEQADTAYYNAASVRGISRAQQHAAMVNRSICRLVATKGANLGAESGLERALESSNRPAQWQAYLLYAVAVAHMRYERDGQAIEDLEAAEHILRSGPFKDDELLLQVLLLLERCFASMANDDHLAVMRRLEGHAQKMGRPMKLLDFNVAKTPLNIVRFMPIEGV